MQQKQLKTLLDELLSSSIVNDFCPNGLQVEGRDEVQHIVTGVTASLALIDKAIELKADTILVHHGYFWKNESYSIVGMKKRRIAKLLAHDINLFAYHLPLDIHPQLGNNRQLGELLGINDIHALDAITPKGIVMCGHLKNAVSHDAFKAHLAEQLDHSVVSINHHKDIKKVAWCTGGGQNFIDQVAALELGIDAFISGEISEQTTHSAREQDIDYFAVGHHASERYGVKALGEYLAKTYPLKVSFVDIDNPA